MRYPTVWLCVCVALAWGCRDGGRERAPARKAVAPTHVPPPMPDAAETARFGRCEGSPGDKPIMAPCADHCECSTGYCYDEGYLGDDFRFCTMDCDAPTVGKCSSIVHPQRPHQQGYGCLQLDGLAKARGLETTRLCVLRCAGIDECRGYSDRYDQCGNYSGNKSTMWEGRMIAAFASCIISSEVDPESPR